MVTLRTKFFVLRHTYALVPYNKIFKRNYMENIAQQKIEKKIHPYKQIHPWKSFTEFSEDLLNNIIYNKDGLVALNKPYGIRRSINKLNQNVQNIPNAVSYTLEEALPYIANQLHYSNLIIVSTPEVYMSGITLLAASIKIQHAIELAFIRSEYFAKTYWVVTVGVPRDLNGYNRLALRLISNPEFQHKKAILSTSWSKNEEKSRKINILKTDHEVLSNSTLNLCSFMRIKASTNRRHAIRMFASTFLYCPVLGDNICASQIQKVGNTFVKVDPFLIHSAPPKLDRRLLQLLNITPSQQNIIPAHIHLRSVVLPQIFGETLTLDAPLFPYFNWTYKQLEFKYVI